MNKQEQRTAIAEACGWRREYAFGNGIDDELWITPKGLTAGRASDPLNALPDYLNNLNDMHEAEALLTPRLFTRYTEILLPIVDPLFKAWPADGQGIHANEAFRLLHASAEQRAEAFLRTIGKWKESPVHPSIVNPNKIIKAIIFDS